MKTYKQLMEVMSISDMNKITGGTAAQRKIAQDRQRAREAKDKGFDPKKSVMADGSRPSDEQKSSTTVKAEPTSKKGGEIVKAEPAAIKKPDLRKSQIGKWSQGVKNSPGKLAKKSGAIVKAQETKPASPEIQKADVKVLKKDGMQGQQATRPATTKTEPTQEDPKKSKEKKSKKPLNIGKHLNRLRKGAQKGIGLAKKGLDMGGEAPVDTYGEGEKRGLQQRNKGLGN